MPRRQLSISWVNDPMLIIFYLQNLISIWGLIGPGLNFSSGQPYNFLLYFL